MLDSESFRQLQEISAKLKLLFQEMITMKLQLFFRMLEVGARASWSWEQIRSE
jgi:hypothetical protein